MRDDARCCDATSFLKRKHDIVGSNEGGAGVTVRRDDGMTGR